VDGGLVYYIGYHGHQYRFLVFEAELLALFADITPLRAELRLGLQLAAAGMKPVNKIFWGGLARTWASDETSSSYMLHHTAVATGHADWFHEMSLDATARVQRAMDESD